MADRRYTPDGLPVVTSSLIETSSHDIDDGSNNAYEQQYQKNLRRFQEENPHL